MERIVSLMLAFMMLFSAMGLCCSANQTTSDFAYFMENAYFSSDNTIEISLALTGVQGSTDSVSAQCYIPLYHPKTGKLMELHSISVELLMPFVNSGRVRIEKQLVLSAQHLNEYRVKAILLESLDTLSPVGTTMYQMNEMTASNVNGILQNVVVVRTPKINLEPDVPQISVVNDNAMYVKTEDNRYAKITVPNSDAFRYIGQQVDIAYQRDVEDSNIKTLTNIAPNHSVHNYERIRLSDIISIDNDGMEYYTDTTNQWKNKVTFHETPVVICNGEFLREGIDAVCGNISSSGGLLFVYVSDTYTLVKVNFVKIETIKGVMVVRTPKINLEPTVSQISVVNSNAMYVKKPDNSYLKVFTSNASDFDYIGQMVDITIKSDAEDPDVKTLTGITRSSGVQVYENIRLSDLISIDNNGFEYYTNKANNKTEKASFNGTPYVIYNERFHQNGIAAISADIGSADGVVSIYIANNHTFIKAKSYQTYVVESTSTKNETITVKGSSTPIYVPYKDTNTFETLFRKGTFDYSTGSFAANASSSSLSGISKGNIIAVAKSALYPADATAITSSGYYCEVLISSTTIKGTVNEYTTHDATGRPIIKVGSSSNEYLLSQELGNYTLGGKNMSSLVQAGVTATFYVDPFGEIGYVSDLKADDIRVGIPLKVRNDGSGIDATTYVDIYNVDSKKVEEKLQLENESDAQNLYENGALAVSKLCYYTVKNGKIESINLIKAGSEDYDYIAAKSAVESEVDIKKESSSKISFDGKTIDPFNTQVVLIGLKDSDNVTPTAATMTTGLTYSGRVYQLNLTKSGTNNHKQYVIIRPSTQLTKDSPTYIVDKIGCAVLKEDKIVQTVTVYPFTGTSKTGSSAGSRDLVITQDVIITLNLKKGDVFTYTKIPGTTGIEIETLDNVYVLARANEVANGTYPVADHMTKNDNAKAANCYNRDYNFLGIDSGGNIVAPKSGVYTYYMGVALKYFVDETSEIAHLRIAKDSSGYPILANDTTAIGALKTAQEANAVTDADFYDYEINSLANIFVYDSGETEEFKLQHIKDKDETRNYLSELLTIENSDAPDTVFVKAFNSDNSNNIALYNLYIIR